MSRTIMMSAMGVTLMSAMAPPFFPPTCMDMESTPLRWPPPDGAGGGAGT
jgi:hypothetical protein